MTADEVRMLDNRYALLFIRGEPPVMDLKYDILKHPNLSLTADGGADVYRHGEVTRDVASISVVEMKRLIRGGRSGKASGETNNQNYVLLSEEDVEEIYESEKQKKNKKK